MGFTTVCTEHQLCLQGPLAPGYKHSHAPDGPLHQDAPGGQPSANRVGNRALTQQHNTSVNERSGSRKSKVSTSVPGRRTIAPVQRLNDLESGSS